MLALLTTCFMAREGRVRIIKGLAILFVLGATSAQSSSACYGQQLSLRIPKDPDAADSAHILRLPAPDMWIVNVGGGQNLRDVPCRPEPVPAWSAVIPVAEPIMPDEVRNTLRTQGVRLTTIRISGVTREGIGTYQRSREWWWENVYASAPTTPDGHLRKPSVAGDAVGGSWLLSAAYLDGAGDRIPVSCALECTVDYRIRQSLVLYYRFVVADKTKTPDWIAIDRAVRSVVAEWIDEDSP